MKEEILGDSRGIKRLHKQYSVDMNLKLADEGWFSVRDYMLENKLSRSTANREVKHALDKKLIEKREEVNGCRIIYYRLAKADLK